MTSTPERLARLSPQKLALLKQVMGDSAGIAEPIAVVGMGCRFAGASNVDEYWQLIRDALDKTGEIPASRWDVEEFFDASGKTPGKMTTRWGGFLDNIDRFDATFFGISPREAEKMDPQHRLLLEVVWEALEYGGLSAEGMRESATGVFVGVGGVDYSRIPVQLDNYFEQITAYSGTGNALSIAANRISYTLDLRGPSLSIDTACSSSLVAAHLAVRSLRAKECDAAIVGGVNAILTPETTLAFSQAHMLSPDGKCRPFDDRANGYVRAEGCGVVVLKRLSDAVQSGDIVLATIRGSAVNQDGLTSGITAPRGTAQMRVIRQALRDAGRKPQDVSYVEAHGTATPLGDPIEVQSLAKIFADEHPQESLPCHIGSIKANIGHSETAAGMASLIKTILMLRHRVIPKQVHFESLNRHIDLSGSRLRIAQELTPWDVGDRPRTAGVSSFGFGGTNSHLVLEGASQEPKPSSTPDRPRHVLAISAKSPERLQELAGRFRQSLTDLGEREVADLCHTAAVGRSHFNHRLAIPVRSADQLRESLQSFADGQRSPLIKTGKARSDRRLNVAFLFSGQGSQFVGMGRQLYDTHPVFRQALDQCDEILADLLPRRLLQVLFQDDGDDAALHQTLYTQPALFSLEYSLSRLWRSFGIEPTVMIGHSIGDYAAACEAGVFSLEDGLKLIAHRAQLVQGLPHDGMMAVVFAERQRVADLVQPYAQDVSIAVENGPQNVVISGRGEVVRELLDQFELAGVKSQALEVSHAMHSPLLEPILDDFQRFASEIQYQAPKIPLISSCDGRRIGDRVCDPVYWREHLRHTVHFLDGIETLRPFALDAAVEVGPGTTLCGLAGRVLGSEEIAWLPSLRRNQSDWDVLTATLAELYVRGAAVDWASFDQPFSRKRLVLPTYPFERQSHWYDMSHRRASHVSPLVASSKTTHPLLGLQVPVAGDKRVFEVTIESRRPGFLVDHCIDQRSVVPAAAYMEQAMAVSRRLFGDGNHELRNLHIEQPLTLPDQQRRVVQVQVGPEYRGECSFEVYSRPEALEERDPSASWILHASGTLVKRAETSDADQATDLGELDATMSRRISSDRFYELMRSCGLHYGPLFQVVGELQSGDGQSLTRLNLAEELKKQLDAYVLHPAILDGCLQSIAGVVSDDSSEDQADLFLPVHAERVTVDRKLPDGDLWVHCRLTGHQTETDSFQADIDLLDEQGVRVAAIVGARVQRLSKQRQRRSSEDRNLLYQMRWQVAPVDTDESAATTSARHWLLLADSSELATELADRLLQRGDSVALMRRGDEFVREASAMEGRVDYRLNPERLEDLRRMFTEIASGDAAKLTVVDLMELGSTDHEREGDQAIDHCGRVLLLLRALATSGELKDPRAVLVTRGGQAVGENDPVSPAQASLWGLARSAMVELPHVTCRLVDLDPGQPAPASLQPLLEELMREGTEDHVALRSGQRWVERLEATPDQLSPTQKGDRRTPPDAERFSLRLGTSVGFEGLHYEPIERKELDPGAVEIEVKSTGLNFSDVLKALGLYPGITDEIVPLGIECAGVVTRVGAQVDRFQVGQRVMGVAPYSFGSHTTTAEYAIVATPDCISDDEAATIPITFLTAQHALCRLARLAEGEKVLIHAGAGGVGQAAIQIAQAIGAEIFATAGSDEKREFLRNLGIRHVMDSRSLDFADQILEITSGRGVDVVLNSLPGDAITSSLSILTAYGRFLEIGKTDIYQNRRIGLWPFQDNLSYFAIDLDRMLRQRPEEIRQLYRDLMPHFESGVYRALPLKSFESDRVVDAFRYMAQRKNIGKVVVSMAAAHRQSQANASRSAGATEGTVLITGGFGGLGRKVIDWMVAQGGRHFAILSRRRPNQQIEQRLAELAASGVSVAVLQGDVCDRESLDAALQQLPESFPAIRGVIHAAGVLEDGLIHSMQPEQLRRAMAPKTQGAWNLHRALSDPLDFFVLFSSVAGSIGSPGQANYAAGNAFLDGLAQHRRQLGMPATSIAWGPWDEEGMAADAEVRRQLSERGMRVLAPQTALRVLDRAIRSETSNLVVIDADWTVLMSKMPGGGPSPLASFRAEQAAASSGAGQRSRDEQLCQRLQAASPSERVAELETVIAGTLADVLNIDADKIENDQPLATLGLDSLMGMELRSNLEAKLGIEIPVASLFDDPTVNSLARVSAESFGGSQLQAAEADVAEERPSTAEEPSRSATEPRRRSGVVAMGGAHGNDTALFCVHPVGGDLRCYDSFARALRNRPVYGLRAHGLQAGSSVHQSMNDMVSDYVRAIREVLPDGPYCLMGWSTGGIFAYEMAQRLQEEGTPVQALLMVDTPLPAVFENVDLGDNAKFLVDLVEFANYFAGTSMEISYDVLHRQTEQQALAGVLELAIEHGVLPAKTTHDYLQRLINVCKQHVRILQSYEPQRSDMVVQMIRPEDTGMLSEATGQSHADDLGWGEIVPLQMHHVPGHHFTMMTGDNAVGLAEKIDQLLRLNEPVDVNK